MASNPYIRSAIWLVASGAIGYGLMVLTSPSAETIERIRASSSNTHMTADEQKRKAMFVKRLQGADLSGTSINRQQPAIEKK